MTKSVKNIWDLNEFFSFSGWEKQTPSALSFPVFLLSDSLRVLFMVYPEIANTWLFFFLNNQRTETGLFIQLYRALSTRTAPTIQAPRMWHWQHWCNPGVGNGVDPTTRSVPISSFGILKERSGACAQPPLTLKESSLSSGHSDWQVTAFY